MKIFLFFFFFCGFSPQFGHPPVPTHQPALLCHTTATNHGLRRLIRASSETREASQLNRFELLHHRAVLTLGGKRYLLFRIHELTGALDWMVSL